MLIGYIFDKVNNRSDVDVAEVDFILDRAVKPPSIESIKDSVVAGFRGMFWGFLLGLTLAENFVVLFGEGAVIFLPIGFAVVGAILSVGLSVRKESE